MKQTTLIRALAIALLLGGPAAAASEDGLIIEHGPRSSKQVALTFDACPTGRADEYDVQVIDILTAEKVPATLFLSGRWVEKNPERAKELAGREQFEIGNHAFWHPHMPAKDDARVLAELKRTQDIIRRTTGKRPKYFRPPFGEVDDRVALLVRQAGLVTVQYDIASGDPDPGLSARRIARSVVEEAQGGSIVVLHMNRKGVRTAEALPLIILGLREKGFELVTVGAMLRTAGAVTGRRGNGQIGTGRAGKGAEGPAPGTVSGPAATPAAADPQRGTHP